MLPRDGGKKRVGRSRWWCVIVAADRIKSSRVLWITPDSIEQTTSVHFTLCNPQLIPTLCPRRIPRRVAAARHDLCPKHLPLLTFDYARNTQSSTRLYPPFEKQRSIKGGSRSWRIYLLAVATVRNEDVEKRVKGEGTLKSTSWKWREEWSNWVKSRLNFGNDEETKEEINAPRMVDWRVTKRAETYVKQEFSWARSSSIVTIVSWYWGCDPWRPSSTLPHRLWHKEMLLLQTDQTKSM